MQFSRIEGRLRELLRDRHPHRLRTEIRIAWLEVRALKAEQYSPAVRGRPLTRCGRASHIGRPPLGGGRATEAETLRAPRSHPHLSRVGRANPDLRASSVVDRMYAVANTLGVFQRHVLLRKEVIQPHLPIRLPCYDFVPLT